MPIIIDHTPVDSNMVSELASGYAASVLRRRREQENLGDQIALDTARTANDVQRGKAMGDYAMAQLPGKLAIENAAAVNQARAMLPVEGARARIHNDAKVQAAEAERLRRRQAFAPIMAQLRTSKPAHVPDWLIDLAATDSEENGGIDPKIFDVLRPRTPEQLADAKYQTTMRELAMRKLQRDLERGPAAADAFAQALPEGPPTRMDQVFVTGLQHGDFDLNDPAVRGRLNMLTPSERTAVDRVETAGTPEARRQQAEMRLQIAAHPRVQAAALAMHSAADVLKRLESDPMNATAAMLKTAETKAQAAKVAYIQAVNEVSKAMGLPGVESTLSGGSSANADAPHQPATPSADEPPPGLDDFGRRVWEMTHPKR